MVSDYSLLTYYFMRAYLLHFSRISLLVGISNALASGQVVDSLPVNTLKFDISAGFYYQALVGGDPSSRLHFLTPPYLAQRRPQEPELANRWGLNGLDITDAPQGHGPSYYRFHSWYKLNNSLELYGSITADHRGFSWGPYNTFNLVFIPRYYANYHQTFQLKNGENLTLFGKAGYFEDYRNYEGLTLYNLDLQGLEGGVQWRKLRFSVKQFGDLVQAYGLNTDGVVDYQFSLNGLNWGRGWRSDIKAGSQTLIGFYDDSSQLLTLSANARHDQLAFYLEGSYRKTAPTMQLSTAFLAGVTYKVSTSRLDLNYRLEYRYYGGGFNRNLRNETATHFRRTDQGSGRNFIGDQVYPLSFFGRPFSQWAVFTEYDKQWVQGGTLYTTNSYSLSKAVRLFAELDFNLIIAQGESPFLYPFYNCGVRFGTLSNTFLGLTLTNRTMNLDKHYTTYYATQTPIFQLELKRDLSHR